MAQPTYAQLRSLQTSAASVVPETIQERILTVLAMIASGQNPDASTFNLVTPGAGGAGPYVPVTGTYALATTVVETDQVTGDTNPRFSRTADGKLRWGAGNIALDTTLERASSTTLKISNNLNLVSEIVAVIGGAAQTRVGDEGPAGQAGFLLGIANDTNFYRSAAGVLKTDGSLVVGTTSAGGKLSTSRGIFSGALPTKTFTSTVGAQVDTTSDRFISVPITYTLIGSTVLVEVSPDNVTYSTVVTKAPGIAGDVDTIDLFVPAGWYVRLTTTNATIAAAAYW